MTHQQCSWPVTKQKIMENNWEKLMVIALPISSRYYAVTHCDMLFWADPSALSHQWTALQCCRTFRFKKHPKLILTPLFQSTPISFGQIGQSQTSRIFGSSWSSSKMWDIGFAHKINLLIFRNFRIFGLGLPYYFDQCGNISKLKRNVFKVRNIII